MLTASGTETRCHLYLETTTFLDNPDMTIHDPCDKNIALESYYDLENTVSEYPMGPTGYRARGILAYNDCGDRYVSRPVMRDKSGQERDLGWSLLAYKL